MEDIVAEAAAFSLPFPHKRVRLEVILVVNKELTEPGAWIWNSSLGYQDLLQTMFQGTLATPDRCSLKKGFCGQQGWEILHICPPFRDLQCLRIVKKTQLPLVSSQKTCSLAQV